MTPAPALASSPVVPQGPAALSRTGASAIKGPAAPGATRAQVAMRGDRATAGRRTRGGTDFAGVLATAQADDRAGGVEETRSAGASSAFAARPETEASGAIAPEAPVHEAQVGSVDLLGAPAPPPWQGLAFGGGSASAADPGARASQMAAPVTSTAPPLVPSGSVIPTVQPLVSTPAGDGAAESVQPAVLDGGATPAGPLPPNDPGTPSVSGPSPAAARAAASLVHAPGPPGPVDDVGRAEVAGSLAHEGPPIASSTGPRAGRLREAVLRLTDSVAGPPSSAREADAALPFGPAAATAPVGPMLHDLAPNAAAPAVPLPPSGGDQVLHQVVSSLKMQWKDGIGEATLHLRPDALGAVSVSLRVEAGAVTAVVRADSPQVQEWVVQHQQTLREQMESAGLRLDDLVVTPDDQPRSGRQKGAPPEPRRRSQPAKPASDAPTFDQFL